MNQGRLKHIDIAKGIAICLMVYGHTNSYGMSFIYSFHMPLFFVLSGYLTKLNVPDGQALKFAVGEVKKKLKGLYLPWLKYNLLFILLHNALFRLYVYNVDYDYSNQFVTPFGARDYLVHIVKTVLMLDKPELMVVGYWFLQVLFLSFLLLYAMRLIVKRPWIMLVLFVVLYVFALVLKGYVDFKWIFIKIIAADIYLVTGILIREYWEKIIKWFTPVFTLVCFGLLLLYNIFCPHMTMDFLNINEFPTYFVVSMIGSMGALSLSCQIARADRAKWLSNTFSYIGERTLKILTWHFTGFKVVTLLLVQMMGIGITHLGEFPVLEGLDYHWILLYAMVGVGLPLLFDYGANNVKERLYEKK